MLISIIQQSDSVVYVYIYIYIYIYICFFSILFLYGLSQDFEDMYVYCKMITSS